MTDKDNIMILCKVVDNFGDIGVVYRLARALCDARPSLKLTLVVSNLESFHALATKIDPAKPIQRFWYKNSEWTVIDWNLKTENVRTAFPQFSPSCFPFSVILECFQCGRPDWLEQILFSEDFSATVQILNIDYLTAEDYAEEFHLLKSGTRKANIKKRFFMPGFTEKTGGLILNEKPTISADLADSAALADSACFIPAPDSSLFSIFFFAYEDDCAAVVRGIAGFQRTMRESDSDFAVCVFVAAGKSREPFVRAWHEAGEPFAVKELPFMPQEAFDAFIVKMDFLFVRGEDSLARAALSGIPYVWQAYKQDENYQLVKVNALLELMKPFFDETAFAAVGAFWRSYNDSESETESGLLTRLLVSSAKGENAAGFRAFSERLFKNGNLAEHLLAHIDTL